MVIFLVIEKQTVTTVQVLSVGEAQLLAYHDAVPSHIPLQYNDHACVGHDYQRTRSLADIYAHLVICFDNPICICPFHPPSLCVACSRATPSLALVRFVGDPLRSLPIERT